MILNNTQPSFSSGILSDELFSRIDYTKVSSGLKQCNNFLVRPAGGVEFRPGTMYVAEAKANARLIPFVYNKDNGFCLEFSNNLIRIIKDGAVVVDSDGDEIEITTSYSSDDIGLIKYAQNKNTMYLTHQSYCPAKLERISDTEWELSDVVFQPSVVTVPSVTATAQTAEETATIVLYDDWQYAVSVVDEDDNEGLPVYSNVVSSDIDLLNQNIKVTFSPPDDTTGIDRFYIYRIDGGRFYFVYSIDYNESTTEYSFTDLDFSTDTTQAVKELFDDFYEGNYPSTVGIWNQRLLLANTQEDPNDIWLSNVGDYEDFTNTVNNSADEAINLTLSSGTGDSILGVAPLEDLIVFTDTKVWRVTGTSASDMLAYVESYSGASDVPPAVSKKSVLYVDSSENSVSNFIYSYELNGYSGQALDTLCRTLFDGYELTSGCLRNNPYSVYYCIRNDGVLLCLTYLREENIYAWSTFSTDGLYKDIISISKNLNDQMYVIVERNGVDYIELMKSNINSFEGLDDAWHLDCASKFVSNWVEWENVSSTTTTTTYLGYDREGYYENKTWRVVQMDWWNSSGNGPYDLYFLTDDSSISETMNFRYYQSYYNSGFPDEIDINSYTSEYPLNENYTYNNRTTQLSFTGQTFTEVIYVEDYSDRYITNLILGGVVYDSDKNKVGNIGSYTTDTITVGSAVYNRNSSLDETVTDSSSNISLLYTKGDPISGGYCYTNTSESSSKIITSYTDDTITVDSKVYTKTDAEVGQKTISGLTRFNDRLVTVVADGNEYKDIPVVDGEIDLELESSNILVGLPYDGIIQTIPVEMQISTGVTSFGYNRKTFNGVLNYYRTRGLWYGSSEDSLYEIKPYTNETFGETIPLETAKMILRVSDGYNNESTFFVAQKSPFPALIMNLTLGVDLSGKT